MTLNPAQAAAACDLDRHVLVAAGAGTGKTQCVVGRLLYALGEEVAGRRVPPAARLELRDIAAITFTNVAAADLARKLREALAAAGRREDACRVDTARIGTIHAFCGRILREFALQLDRPPGLEILDEAERVALALDAAREELLAAIEQHDPPDLEPLLAEYAVDEVFEWVARLAGEADRLAQLARDPEADARERAILTLAGRTLTRLRRWLAERSAFDFDSMIGLTRDLLRDHPGVRRTLQRRIRLLIIDEFQDVDPVQQEIAWLLGEPESGRPETTRLMLVGDPKQSIFRFRRADVAVWTRVQRRFEAGAGAVHTLTENFRSRRPILALVDAVIGPALDDLVDPDAGRADFEVPSQPLAACPKHDTREPCVELLLLPPDEKGNVRTGNDARDLEIPAVARRVAELVAGGTKPGEIAILLPAWAPLERYRAELAARGIASWALRTEQYWERREVLDCVLGLQVLLDPQDDVALCGFLRGPMVGVRDDTLLALARLSRQPYWHHLRKIECPESDLLAFAAEVIERLAPLRDRIPHDALLEELLDATGYLAHLHLLGEDARQAVANVEKLVRKLRGWRRLTLREALRDIADVRERAEGTREGDAPLGARDDAVTLTSIHSAKGLEWPVVVWADVARGAALPPWQFVVGRQAVRLRAPDADRPDADPRFAAVRRAEELEERAERKRLWYVAATRARDRLIVAGVPLGAANQRLAGTAAEYLRRGLGLEGARAPGPVSYRDHRGETFSATVVEVRPEKGGLPPPGPAPVRPASMLGEPPPRLVVPAGRPRHSASELLTFQRCARKHWFAYTAGLREPAVNRDTPEFLDAITRGQIVHDVLEHLREQDELDAILEDAIGRWDPEAPPPDGAEGVRYRAVLREEIAGVASHPAYRAVADLPGARRELGFVSLAAPGRWFQGRIDLAAPGSDGLVLVDVKTSDVRDPAAARRRALAYGLQREVYTGAVEAVSDRPVAAFAFHFSRTGEHLAEPVTRAEREHGARILAEILAAIEAGERGLTANPHECRFCGYRQAGWCEGARWPKPAEDQGAARSEPPRA
jgi:ATP-dependent helicase/nuclease subunit A